MKESHREVAKANQKFYFPLVLPKEILSGTLFQVPYVNYILHPWLQTRNSEMGFRSKSQLYARSNEHGDMAFTTRPAAFSWILQFARNMADEVAKSGETELLSREIRIWESLGAKAS